MGGRAAKGASQNNRQTQIQSNAPPPWAVPLYAQGAADLQELYRSGRGGNVYQGTRVANLSDETTKAIEGIGRTAAAFDNADLQTRLGATPQAAQNLAQLAAGSAIGQNNAFNSALQNELDRSATLINSRLSGAGRYGSGAHSGVLARELGQVAARARSDQYNRDIDNQLAANAQIDRANQSQLGLVNDSLRQQTDAYRAALAAGQVRDAQAQSRLDSERQRWLENDDREWERLGRYQALVNGLAGDYGTRSGQSQTTARRNPGLFETAQGLGRLAGKR